MPSFQKLVVAIQHFYIEKFNFEIFWVIEKFLVFKKHLGFLEPHPRTNILKVFLSFSKKDSGHQTLKKFPSSPGVISNASVQPTLNFRKSSRSELIKDVVVALLLHTVGDSRLLQQVGLNVSAGNGVLRRKVNANELALVSFKFSFKIHNCQELDTNKSS